MADDFYGYDDEEDAPKGRDNLFLWTVFILLLIGSAFACWLGSFYIFGHPENPRSYRILKKMGKIAAPQRFEVTAAPQGEFLNPQKLYERYAKFTPLEFDNENSELIRNYLRNYKETKRLATYCTGKFVIVKSFQLKQTDFFPSGVVALAEASDFPQVVIEHVYTSNAQNVPSLLALLHTGEAVKMVRTDDLSAVVHVERIGDGRMQFTVVPLLYGSYGMTEGPGQFSLEPPTELNMEPGLPVIRSTQLQESFKLFAAFRSKHPAEFAESGAEPAKSAPSPELVRVDTVPPGEPVPLTGTMTPIPVATPVPVQVAVRATPKISLPKFASGKTSPTPSMRGAASPTPAVRVAMLTTPRPRPISTPVPVATAIPVAPAVAANGEPPPGVSPSGVRLNPFIKSQRDPSLANTGSSWRTYAPGQAPPGKMVGLDDVAALAERGEIGERLYLRGDFRVTASSPSRAVLRDANKPDDQSPRVLVEYPSGAVAPQERDRLSRDSSRPYQIYNVRRGPDGVVTIWVKEITQ
jgi:hypothetical protein